MYVSTQMWEEFVQSKEIKGWFHYFPVFLGFFAKKINTNKFFENVVKNCIKVAKEMISNIFKKKLFLMKLTFIKLSNSFAVFIAWKCPIYAHRRVFFPKKCIPYAYSVSALLKMQYENWTIYLNYFLFFSIWYENWDNLFPHMFCGRT